MANGTPSISTELERHVAVRPEQKCLKIKSPVKLDPG